MTDPVDMFSEHRLGLILRMKTRCLWNRLIQSLARTPVRVAGTVLLVACIWLGLYWLFHMVFRQFDRTPLEATVAVPLVFNVFFVAILAMLVFSNAVIAYGALFHRGEAAYLLACPVTPLDIVTVKYLESLVLSSWSLVLLGVPLMMAMADRSRDSAFYLLFIAFFLAFIPIPGAIGLFLAWFSTQFVSRRLARAAAVVGGILLVALTVWTLRSLRIGEAATEAWLRSFLTRMSFVEIVFLPNYWVAAGIDRALQGRLVDALPYLGVTLANAWFLSWLAVRVVARSFHRAFDRASASRATYIRGAARASGGPAGALFWYLPLSLRLIAAKDLRTFLRDPIQWSQLVILFGLLLLYLTNMPTLRVQFIGMRWFLVVPFLNLCAICLILATFTCRFVFPLVSLEGQQLWLVGLLPIRRGRILLAKFAFAMTVTTAVAVIAILLAVEMLQLDRIWSVIHLIITLSTCVGLCGFAVGLGGRLPMFTESNPARIANGLGGTSNLLASVSLVALMLTGVGIATWRSRDLAENALPDAWSLFWCAASALTGATAGLLALAAGSRHFDRVEV